MLRVAFSCGPSAAACVRPSPSLKRPAGCGAHSRQDQTGTLEGVTGAAVRRIQRALQAAVASGRAWGLRVGCAGVWQPPWHQPAVRRASTTTDGFPLRTGARAAAPHGRWIDTLHPSPRLDVTPTQPPCASTKARTRASPRPSPLD